MSQNSFKDEDPPHKVCPICHQEDQHNRVMGVPWCLMCGHRLVNREDLKHYNREYRRKWKPQGPFKGINAKGVNVTRRLKPT